MAMDVFLPRLNPTAMADVQIPVTNDPLAASPTHTYYNGRSPPDVASKTLAAGMGHSATGSPTFHIGSESLDMFSTSHSFVGVLTGRPYAPSCVPDVLHGTNLFMTRPDRKSIGCGEDKIRKKPAAIEELEV